jgi:hypothetical protein
MGKGISQSVGAHELEPVSLGEMIHRHVHRVRGQRRWGSCRLRNLRAHVGQGKEVTNSHVHHLR